MPTTTRLVAFALLAALLITQRPVSLRAAQLAGAGIWQTASEQSIPGASRRSNIGGQYAVVRLDRSALDDQLARAPKEDDSSPSRQDVIIPLPLPDGRFGRFEIQESPILVPELAAAFPEIKTYRGQGLDDPTATARLDWTADGFHGQVIAKDGTVYIDPYAKGDLTLYVSFGKGDLQSQGGSFSDIVDVQTAVALHPLTEFPLTAGGTTRTYRLALAATAEYTTAAAGVSGAVSRIATTMNRVNGIYEREVAVRMTVATGPAGLPTALIYTNSATDPYSNNDGVAMLAQNQTNLDSVIGTANYDVGHVFSTGGGGVATLGVPCVAGSKARGVTGLPNPVGDAFDVDYVAHEMGHQFSGNHTFNGNAPGTSCAGGNRSASHAYEVGSGNTIMAYAGICPPEDLQAHSNDYFNVESLNEIVPFITSGSGSTCGTTNATGNSAPALPAGTPSFTIPVGTPFTLTTSATDANGDTVTFDWEQYNLGTASTSVATASTDDGTRPLFRSYLPTISPSRTFPSLTYILNNANVPPQTNICTVGTCLTGETLPATSRVMTFAVTARDNRVGGGGIATALTNVTSTTSAGPFIVTVPNTAVSWTGNTFQAVTWNVANTNASPVNAANVKISLSSDGGLTFPTVLSASTPNTGAANVLVPNTPMSTARVKVEAVGNVFFDISNTNFTIVMGSVTPTTTRDGDFDGDGKADVAVFRPSTGNWFISGTSVSSSYTWGGAGDVPVARDFDGDGKIDVAVFRPATGVWFIWQSRTQTGITYTWGGAGDIPVPRDFDGDGKSDIAVFRPSTGNWFIWQSGSQTAITYTWGGAGDIPVSRDFDGDGKADIAVFRPATGNWFIWQSGSQTGLTYTWGGAGDIPVSADYDGDGKTDVAVFRPATGIWFIWQSGSQTGLSYTWGGGTDIPVPGDYDGDGKADIGVFRPSTGAWFIWRSGPQTGLTYTWGGAGDIPILKRP